MSRRRRQSVSWCSSHCHGWRSRRSRSRSGGRLRRPRGSRGKCGSRGIPPENKALSRFRRSRRLRLSCRGWSQCSRRRQCSRWHESGGWHNSRRRNRSARRARRGCALPFPLPGRRWRHRRSGGYSRSMSGCRRRCHGGSRCRSGRVSGCRRECRSWRRRVGRPRCRSCYNCNCVRRR